MSRKLAVERTYALRQYENIKLYDEIIIPDGKEFDSELIDKIRKLQFVQLELMYRKYVKLIENIMPMNVEEQTKALFEMRDNLTEFIETKAGE